MKLVVLAVTLCLAVLLWPQSVLTQAQQKPEEAAQKSAEVWLALADAGKYAETWDEAAALFKNAVTKDQWLSAMKSVRTPLGGVQSRKLATATYTKTLPGAPDGNYVVITFNTSFERKAAAVETITPMLDKDGRWRVSGYFIK